MLLTRLTKKLSIYCSMYAKKQKIIKIGKQQTLSAINSLKSDLKSKIPKTVLNGN